MASSPSRFHDGAWLSSLGGRRENSSPSSRITLRARKGAVMAVCHSISCGCASVVVATCTFLPHNRDVSCCCRQVHPLSCSIVVRPSANYTFLVKRIRCFSHKRLLTPLVKLCHVLQHARVRPVGSLGPRCEFFGPLLERLLALVVAFESVLYDVLHGQAMALIIQPHRIHNYDLAWIAAVSWRSASCLNARQNCYTHIFRSEQMSRYQCGRFPRHNSWSGRLGRRFVKFGFADRQT